MVTRRRRPMLRFAILWTVAMAAQLLLWFPWHPQVLQPGLDSSYFYEVGELFVSRAQFADFSQNHGPFGFAKNDLYDPRTFGLLIGIRIALAVVFALLAARLASRWRDSLRSGVLWIVMLVAVARYGEAWFLSLAVLAFLVFWSAVTSEDRARWSPIVLALSLASLMKLTYLFFGVALVGLMVLTMLLDLASGRFRERTVGLAGRLGVALAWPAIYVIGLLLLWVAAGQDVSRLGDLIARWLAFSASFNESHALAGPAYRIVVLIVASAAFWLVFAATEARRSGLRAVAPVLALGLGLAVTIKYSFVRYDAAHIGHGAFQGLCLTMLFGLMMLRRDEPEHRPGGRTPALVAIAAMTAASLLLITYDREHWYGARFFRHLDLRTTTQRMERFVRDPAHLRARHERALARIRRDNPLPRIEGSVDVYPWELSIAFAHHLPLDSRPSLISDGADVPGIAAANARHLAARDGPGHVLFRVGTIDHRYPALDDGPSWLLLLTDFQLRSSRGSHLVLRRSETRRALQRREPSLRQIAFGQRLAVTHGLDRMLWVRIDPTRTRRGGVVSTIYRGPIMYLHVELQDGRDRWFRLVPSSARAGFLLSPLVEDNAGFLALLDGSWPRRLASDRVRALSVETEFGAGWYWDDELRVELEEITIR